MSTNGRGPVANIVEIQIYRKDSFARSMDHPIPAIAKRTFDIVVALGAMIVLSPLFFAIFVIIYLGAPGSNPIFRQSRTGYHGRRFGMFKFRTMVPNAEELKAELAHLNVLQPPDFKIPNDPRITGIGRFLRRTSLDELPQLLNILMGDMSFVGPRPTSFKPETYVTWHGERLEVKPGLTGLWQIRGRGAMEFDERSRLDIWYLRNWSLRLDLKLLWLTAVAVLRRSGAY